MQHIPIIGKSLWQQIQHFTCRNGQSYWFFFRSWQSFQGRIQQFRRKMCDKALERNISRVDAYKNKGISFNLLGKFHEAIEMFNKALEINPQDSQVYSNKGNSFHKLERFEEAILMYDKAHQIDPNDQANLQNRDLTLKQMTNFD